MKRYLMILFSFLFLISLSNCRALYRVYNDEELESMAMNDYGFSSVLFFKIVDSDTAIELTGEAYNNSGVIYGVRDGQYQMLFVPKSMSKEVFNVDYSPIYNVIEIYQILNSLEDDLGSKLFNDPSGDYGGLSLGVSPYEDVLEHNSNLTLDSPLFFIVTTDEMIFYISSMQGKYVVFDQEYNQLNEISD
ncbi:hypothetical protein ACAG96_05410 [Candidatus Izemoplasma sp. B36]|uniref:hypothetical protein n=1 Tax=Candidatus Izemoplasma sp. B36 TaxID=3242468 RepID=UPI00355739FA